MILVSQVCVFCVDCSSSSSSFRAILGFINGKFSVGGVTSMDSFLKKFFPSVYHKESEKHNENMYCKFESHLLQLFTSSLYLAALVASFFASTVTRVFGRKVSMLFGGLVFLVGAVLNGVAMNVAMLIIGRLLLGVGVGFANQVSYLSVSLHFVVNHW